ncbi:MAG: hypothetical protein AAB865_01210 [Patescibacteria group bacterium]
MTSTLLWFLENMDGRARAQLVMAIRRPLIGHEGMDECRHIELSLARMEAGRVVMLHEACFVPPPPVIIGNPGQPGATTKAVRLLQFEDYETDATIPGLPPDQRGAIRFDELVIATALLPGEANALFTLLFGLAMELIEEPDAIDLADRYGKRGVMLAVLAAR